MTNAITFWGSCQLSRSGTCLSSMSLPVPSPLQICQLHLLITSWFPSLFSILDISGLNSCSLMLLHLLPKSYLHPHPHDLIQFSSVAQSCPNLCYPKDCSTPDFPAHHQLPEPTQTHVHRVGDAIQPFHPLLSPSPPSNLSQHQDLFKWVSSSHQVAKVLEFQLQHQSFQWIFRIDFL